MSATTYHVLHQTLASFDTKSATEIGKKVLMSEYYFQQEVAISRFQELMENRFCNVDGIDGTTPTTEELIQRLSTKNVCGLTVGGGSIYG